LPLYDYQCRTCSKVSEVRHGFREDFEGTCPACGSDEMSRVFNPAGIVFKGSGFYVNDSRPKSTESGPSTTAPAAPAAPAASGAAPAAPPAPAAASDSAPKKSESSAA
jgi:putative FmdB family regulatory protein